MDICVTESVTLCSVSANSIKEISYILSLFSNKGINIDMISAVLPQGHKKSFSFSFADDDFDKAVEIIKQLKDENYNSLPALSVGNTKLVISGDMERKCGVASEIISRINEFDILMITTAVNEISVLTTKADENHIIDRIKNL